MRTVALRPSPWVGQTKTLTRYPSSGRPLSKASASSSEHSAEGPSEREKPGRELGNSLHGDKRRKGRPAHLRSPYDTPLRDGNRDRLLGLLTERAAKTLAYYLMETNLNVHHWLTGFLKSNPIPREGHWSDVSGDTFLRKLLSMPIEDAKYDIGRDSLFDNSSVCGVDPRSIASRIMDIRVQLAAEFVQELAQIAEDNKTLQLESLQASFLSTTEVAERTYSSTADASSASFSSSPAATASQGGGGRLVGRNTLKERPADTGGAERERAAVSKYKRKPVVLPASSAPTNWRLRVEVELEVHGPGGSAPSHMPDNLVKGNKSLSHNALDDLVSDDGSDVNSSDSDATPTAALNDALPSVQPSKLEPPPPPHLEVTSDMAAALEALLPPPNAQTPPPSAAAGMGEAASPAVRPPSPASDGPADGPRVPAGAVMGSSSVSSSLRPSGGGGSGSFAPLHPEVAELLPVLRTRPDALTADVASLLASYAFSSGGRLHPDVAEALIAAQRAGARLHPEIAELLTPYGLTPDAPLHSDEE